MRQDRPDHQIPRVCLRQIRRNKKKTNRQVIADRLFCQGIFWGESPMTRGSGARGGTGEGVRPDRGRGVISKDRIIR